jgi:organic radical activating enzyme
VTEAAAENATAPPRLSDLNVLVGRKCNAACAHCSISSSPANVRRMDEATLAAVCGQIPAFARWMPGGRVVVTGGEPLLYRRQLETIGEAAHAHGLALVVETNGHWAKNPDIARTTILRYGIDALILSASAYHAAFVAPERVATAYRAAKSLGRDASVRISRAGSDHEAILDFVRTFADERDVAVEEVLAFGRGEGLARPAQADEDELLLCPSEGPIVMDDGRVDPCCGPLTALDGHALGMGSIDSPEGHPFAMMEADPVFDLIRRRGLHALIDGLRAEGAEVRARRPGEDVCTTCARLVGDPALEASIARLRSIQPPAPAGVGSAQSRLEKIRKSSPSSQ